MKKLLALALAALTLLGTVSCTVTRRQTQTAATSSIPDIRYDPET